MFNESVIHLTGGGCIFLCRHFFFPMPAHKKLILWHITIFAFHAFAVTLFFFVRITRRVMLFLHFSPLRNSCLYTSRLFFYFNARHLLKNIFHYASPYCVYSLARHLLRQMFQYTSRSWISNSMHVTCCVRSLIMRHGWFHSVRFHCWISFIWHICREGGPDPALQRAGACRTRLL